MVSFISKVTAIVLALQAVVVAANAAGQDQDRPQAVSPNDIPANQDEPFLRIEAGGPQSYVTSVAFNATGTTLYAAGWDKVVHVWSRDQATGKFVLQPQSTLRLPVGPGLLGAINAMALSEDGRWLAVGGHGIFQGAASFRQSGRVVPSEGIMTAEMRRDEGVVYLFDLHDNSVRTVRGHVGSVVALTFAPGVGDVPILVSAGREWLVTKSKPAGYSGFVRAWNCDEADPQRWLVAASQFPEPANRRPGIAARRVGERPDEIEVAVQLGDGRYRLWNVAENRMQDFPCGRYGNAVGYSAESDGFVTGVLNQVGADFHGQLETRNANRVLNKQSLSLARSNDYLIPRCLAIGGGSEDGELVAVASRPVARGSQRSAPNQFMLQISKLGRSGFAETLGPCPLWEVPATGAVPAIAASRTGGMIAVAGGLDHSIWLFDANQIRVNGAPFQVLKNAGTRWNEVTFVKKENQRGLRLKNGKDQLTYNLLDQSIVGESQGWAPNGARVDDWTIAQPKQADGRVTILRGGRRVSELVLPEKEVVSASAILPGSEPKAGTDRQPNDVRPTIVAVASHDLGQPTLRLYRADTGEPFRQLTGHSQVIDHLAFEAGSGLLASVATDQTVCLWDLSDVRSILGKQGMLAGTTVAPSERQSPEVTVVKVGAAASPDVRKNLRPGDRLQHITIEGDERTWTTAREFFDAFWSLIPGSTVELAVLRGSEPRSVTVPVGQGIDERKPLLSFFFASAATNDSDRHWIAWSPMGPYEASSRDAERFLGWHFNADPASHPRFAPASEYRETYYREGLIRELVETRSLAVRPVERPKIVTLGFGPEAQQEWTSGESIIIRQPPQTLHVFVSDLASKHVRSIEATFEDAKFGPFTLANEDEWVASVEGLEWKPGKRRCRYVIHTKESPSQAFTYEENVEFVPPRPLIRSDLPADQVVESDVFRFRADTVARGNEPLVVRLSHNGRPLEPSTTDRTQQTLEQEFSLEPGDNLIEIIAYNQSTPEASLANESTRQVYRVTYRKAKALPPKLIARRVDLWDAKTRDWQALETSALQSLVTTRHGRIRIAGTIRADAPISSTEWRIDVAPGEPGERQQFTAEKTADANEWEFMQTVELQPGRQAVRFYSRSADSDEAALALDFNFLPPLPTLAWDTDETGFIERDANEPPAELVVTANLIDFDPQYPFQARVVNNEELIGAPEIDLNSGTMSAKVPLRSGENRIRIAMKNRWHSEGLSSARVWQYRRLPRIANAMHAPVGEVPFTDVTVSVECPLDRPPTQIMVGDQQIVPSQFHKTKTDESISVWEATATGIPLRPGKNAVRVTASTAEGACRQPATLEMTYEGTYWNPPKIEMAQGAPTENVTEPLYELGFAVQSPSKLRNVVVEHDRALLEGETLAIEKLSGENAGERWRATAEIELREGVNRLVVSAQNEGGETRIERIVNYVPPPLTLQIVSLEPVGNPKDAIHPIVNTDGKLTFSKPLPSGHARLKGVVRSRLARSDSPMELKIWANGFQQPPVVLQASRGEHEFAATVVLGEEKKNLVTVDIAGAPLDANSRTVFTVDCLKPQAAQRLHLLVIGANQSDSEAITRRALSAVRAEVDEQGSFRQPLRAAGFYRIQAYPPLVGNVSFSDVFRLLLQVKADLKIPIAPQPGAGRPLAINDVVMLYYEGGILVPDKQHFFLSTSERFDPRNRYSAIASDWLAKFFESMQGAQLAFIDVAAHRPPLEVPVSDWRHDSHAALLCYAWQRGYQPPDNLRLLRAVDQALGTAGRLGEIDTELAKISETAPELDYKRVVPEGLKTLILSRR